MLQNVFLRFLLSLNSLTFDKSIALHLQRFRYHSLTLVFTSYSYETVASILGPPSSITSKVDGQDVAMSSMDSRDLASTPSVEFFSHLVERDACEQEQQEGHCKIRFSKDFIANPVSAEPCMQGLKEDGTQSQPPGCHSRSSLMASSGRKLSALEETDVSKISPKELSGNGATPAHCREKEQSIKGKLTGPTSVNNKNVLASHPITAAEDKIRAASPFLEVDNVR